MVDKYKIALFGGSFDPPTKAHIHVAEQLIEQGIVDDVEFVPAYVSYHGKSYGAHPMDRIELTQHAIEGSRFPANMTVNRFEITNQLETCTYDFVDKFLKMAESDTYCSEVYGLNRDKVEFYFVVGGDNASKVPNFKAGPNGERLLDRIPMIVVNRGDKSVDDIEWCKQEPHIVVDIGLKFGDCSSTKIRNCIRNIDEQGLPADFLNQWCDWQVFAYIMEAEMYTEKSYRNRNWK